MGRAREFDTYVDNAVRQTGRTRKDFARRARVSTSTLFKARALDPDKGGIHWTSLYLIGLEMGVFSIGEWVDEHDPRLKKLARSLVSTRGRMAANFEPLPRAKKKRRHLRSVA